MPIQLNVVPAEVWTLTRDGSKATILDGSFEGTELRGYFC
jgi:hypothetical protein